MYFLGQTLRGACCICPGVLIARMNTLESLISTLLTKGILYRDVKAQSLNAFKQLETLLEDLQGVLKKDSRIKDSGINVAFKESRSAEMEFHLAEDVLVFVLHTDALVFETSHPIWKSPYVSLDPRRGTCGMISVYNFLSDSLEKDRRQDTGTLIARIFINSEGKFFAEGKRQLGVLFNDYPNQMADSKNLMAFVISCLALSLDVDATVPPFDSMKEINVHQIKQYTFQSVIATSKRLGFQVEDSTGK